VSEGNAPTGRRYWEDRAGILKGEITRERAEKCYAEAQALPHSGLQGDLDTGFTYAAGYHESLGPCVLVRIHPLPGPRPLSTAGDGAVAGQPGDASPDAVAES
jgi:hypothetical protein